jgi:predicted deacetylase
VNTAAAAPPPQKLAAIVVHDVAPATWPQCTKLLAMIDALGAPPVTLLVVPHFHRGIHARDSQAFVAALTARVARGDELALHGYYHVDDGPRPCSLGALVARRVLTRGEAEFAAIDAGAAQQRLADGMALFDQAAWPLAGFVPPAWQLNAATRHAIDAAGTRITYVPVRSGIYRLPGWRFESTANLCYSPDRRWRRARSRPGEGGVLGEPRRGAGEARAATIAAAVAASARCRHSRRGGALAGTHRARAAHAAARHQARGHGHRPAARRYAIGRRASARGIVNVPPHPRRFPRLRESSGLPGIYAAAPVVVLPFVALLVRRGKLNGTWFIDSRRKPAPRNAIAQSTSSAP